MTTTLTNLFPPGASPTFSGHETFALRSTWLKKAYDILRYTPDLFYREDSFVLLGVGKNMAQSIRQLMVLMASVVYRQRAIPIAWIVVKGKQGHLPQATHCALIQQVQHVM